ncbi:MAG: LCP family protein [Oscillospiraceae bacterium]|nr:LCP family protein [Oscillospiraceae bacterium]
MSDFRDSRRSSQSGAANRGQAGRSTPQGRSGQSSRSSQTTYRAASNRGSQNAHSRATQGGQVSHSSNRPPQRRRRKKRGNPILKAFLAVILIIGIISGAFYIYLEFAIGTGDAGKLDDDILATAKEMQGNVVNILVCGIDYDTEDDGRDYSEGLGMTDVIMYVNFDLANGQCNILQIPRDTFVGEGVSTGGTNKINAAYSHGDDEKNRINNLARVLNDQFKLPVDHYVTLDMSAFKIMIDTLGGIEMYVPWDVYDDYGNTVPQGTHKIDGATAEFIVRQRHMYGTQDIKRLDMQRYFYAAVFKTFLTFPIKDIAKVAPAVISYVNTDLSVKDMLSLAISLQKLDSSKILLGKMSGGAAKYNGQDVYSPHVGPTADLLNNYFRAFGTAVPAEQLSLQELEPYAGWNDEEPQIMGSLNTGE